MVHKFCFVNNSNLQLPSLLPLSHHHITFNTTTPSLLPRPSPPLHTHHPRHQQNSPSLLLTITQHRVLLLSMRLVLQTATVIAAASVAIVIDKERLVNVYSPYNNNIHANLQSM